MISIAFSVALEPGSSGYENGDLILSGEGGEYRFNCMAVLTASLLLYQVQQWIGSPDEELLFNPIDYTRYISFRKKREKITASFQGKVIGETDRWSLVREIVNACEKLDLEFVQYLPDGDAGRSDFAASLRDFKKAVG